MRQTLLTLAAILASSPATTFAQDGCVEDFEAGLGLFSPTAAYVFGEGANAPVLSVVANPDTAGNPSDSVLRFTEFAGAEPWQGFGVILPERIAFAQGAPQQITLSVWGPRAEAFLLKPQDAADRNVGETAPVEPYDTPGEWKTLVFDFSAFSLNDSMLNQLTFLPAVETTPDTTTAWYVDDLAFGALGACAALADTTDTGLGAPLGEVAPLDARPNPARTAVAVTLAEGATSVVLFDAVGRVALVESLGAPAAAGAVRVLDVAALPAGSYTAVARGESNRVLGRARLLLER